MEKIENLVLSIGTTALLDFELAPGFANVDLRATKFFKLKESFKIECFVEAFNLLNWVNVFVDSEP